MPQEKNWTRITDFVLVGFPTLKPEHYNLVACICCVVYLITVLGNLLLVITFVIEPKLHKPMYIIMLSLALSDIGFSTVTLPKMISRYWFNDYLISFHICLLQMLLVHYFGTVNSYIMGIMALDRYIAICFPLRYPVLMKNRSMTVLNLIAWALSFSATGPMTVLNSNLPYCGPNLIYQCYCDHNSVVKLACSDYSLPNLFAVTSAMLVLLIPLVFIVYSYAHIILCVTKIATSQGQWKTFSTCATQLCIISVYYLPRCVVYIFNITGLYMDLDLRITLILFYSLFPPLVNPFIYCFRTKEIKQLLSTWFSVVNIKKSLIADIPR